MEITLFDSISHGNTYSPTKDRERLGKQLQSVLDYMLGHENVTLPELNEHCPGSEAGLSARIRDLRRLGYRIDRTRVAGGLHSYRLVLP